MQSPQTLHGAVTMQRIIAVPPDNRCFVSVRNYSFPQNGCQGAHVSGLDPYFFVRLPAFSYCIGVRPLRSAESPVRGRRKRPCCRLGPTDSELLTNKGVNPLEDAQIIDLFLARSETAISQTAIRYGRYLKTIAGKGLPLPVQRQSPRAARYAA